MYNMENSNLMYHFFVYVIMCIFLFSEKWCLWFSRQGPCLSYNTSNKCETWICWLWYNIPWLCRFWQLSHILVCELSPPHQQRSKCGAHVWNRTSEALISVFLSAVYCHACLKIWDLSKNASLSGLYGCLMT